MRQVATIGATTTRLMVDAVADEIVALVDTAVLASTYFILDAAFSTAPELSPDLSPKYMVTVGGQEMSLGRGRA